MNQTVAPSTNESAEEPQSRRDAFHYTVVSVEKSNGPDGAPGGDWYRYVIEKPGSPITGYRRGKRSDIMAYITECMGQLEERMQSGKAPRARGRKPKEQIKAQAKEQSAVS